MPDGFQIEYFAAEARMLAQHEEWEERHNRLVEVWPWMVELDSNTRNSAVVALGAGLP